MFDPAINKVRHLGKIPGQESIHHALVEDKNGSIYLGTGRNMFRGNPTVQTEESDRRNRLIKLCGMILRPISGIIREVICTGMHRNRATRKSNFLICPANWKIWAYPWPTIQSMHLQSILPGDEIYGITYPDGHFFVYRIELKKFTDLGAIDDKIVFHGPERYWRSLAQGADM